MGSFANSLGLFKTCLVGNLKTELKSLDTIMFVPILLGLTQSFMSENLIVIITMTAISVFICTFLTLLHKMRHHWMYLYFQSRAAGNVPRGASQCGVHASGPEQEAASHRGQGPHYEGMASCFDMPAYNMF